MSARRNWIGSYHLSFKKFLCDRIGRKNFLKWQKKTKRYPPSPFLLLFLNLKTKSAPSIQSSSDFLTAIWSKILSAKYTESKKQFCYLKRSRWRRKGRGLNKSRMIGSNPSKTG